MKILYLSLICILSLSAGNPPALQEFYEEVYKGYEYLLQLNDNTINTENYNLIVYAGLYQDEDYYSIYFSSNEPNQYDIALKYEGTDEYFYAKENARGDCLVYFLPLEKNLVVDIQLDGTTTNSTVIKLVNFEEIERAQMIQGLGEGLESSIVLHKQINPVVYTLSIVFSAVIVICIIVLSIVFTSKKGMFNKEKFNEEFKKEHQVREQIKEYIYEQNKVMEVEAEEVQEEGKEVYQKQDKYFEEERDISELLRKKGFNTNYSELTTDEKNQVMLELMKMKNFNEITEAEYKSEAIKLWM